MPSAKRSHQPRVWVPLDEDGVPVETLGQDDASKLRERCVSLCLWHLSRAAKTRAELDQAMARHMVPSDMRESVLDQMVRYGYIDDVAYAAAFTRSRLRQRKAGSVISRELARKGIDRDTVSAAVSDIDPEVELSNARALATSRVRSMRHLPTDKQMQRLVGAMARRGYPTSVAWAVAREVVHAE